MSHTLFMKTNPPHKRYKITGLIDSNLTEEEIKLIIESLGFYMFSVEAEK